MDIRDISDVVVYPQGCALEEMYKLQKVLIDHYVGIEGLPPYPIDVNTKSSQILIKDFVGRIVEEFGEAWESYEYMMVLMEMGYDNEVLVPHLQNFNEEIADAMHFWLELLIFSGISSKDVLNWVCENNSEFRLFSNLDALQFGLLSAQNEVMAKYPKILYPHYQVIKDADLKDEFLRGGRYLGEKRKDLMKQMLWDITYYLQLCRNTLKNKPWKQSGMMTDEDRYTEYIKLATLSMFKFFAFSGFTKESLFTIYYKKNKVNLFRIESKY